MAAAPAARSHGRKEVRIIVNAEEKCKIESELSEMSENVLSLLLGASWTDIYLGEQMSQQKHP
jgi:hypothetical protein